MKVFTIGSRERKGSAPTIPNSSYAPMKWPVSSRLMASTVWVRSLTP